MSAKDLALKEQGINPRTKEPYVRLKHGYRADEDKSGSAAAGLARAAAAAPAEAAARDEEITSLKEQVKKLEQLVRIKDSKIHTMANKMAENGLV